jgi:prepilin-type N-terminal cleavage/methylation domain-containing protein
MTRPAAPAPRRPAFTLVETIATMAILAVVGSMASSLVYTAIRSYSDAGMTAQLQDELSVAMERMVRELRGVGLASGTPDISSVTASSITWNTNSSLTLASGELRYSAAGGAAQVLLTGVTEFSVSAFDESDAAMAGTLSGASCAPVRRIQIQVTIARSGRSQTLRSRIFIRSMMEST